MPLGNIPCMPPAERVIYNHQARQKQSRISAHRKLEADDRQSHRYQNEGQVFYHAKFPADIDGPK